MVQAFSKNVNKKQHNLNKETTMQQMCVCVCVGGGGLEKNMALGARFQKRELTVRGRGG